MARTLEEAREDVARACGRLLAGTATAGAVNTIVDTNGLAHLTELDGLVGGLAYIRRDAGGLGAAPEGQSRRITAFTPASDTITVEYNFTAAVAVGDDYEIYLARLALEDWNEAINAAIAGAWPEVWERGVHVVEDLTRWPVYALPAACEEVVEVWAVPFMSVEYADEGLDPAQWMKWDQGFAAQRLPAGVWRVKGTPGADLVLELLRQVGPEGMRLHVWYKGRYAELAAGEETALDWGYFLPAARAEVYARLADRSGTSADRSGFMQLMAHWQNVAEEKKKALEARYQGSGSREQAMGRRGG